MTGHVLTPIAVRVLLHVYYSATSWNDAGEDRSLAAVKAHHVLVGQNLIRLTDQNLAEVASRNPAEFRFGLTERGRVYVEMLLTTPLPVERTEWIDPRTP